MGVFTSRQIHLSATLKLIPMGQDTALPLPLLFGASLGERHQIGDDVGDLLIGEQLAIAKSRHHELRILACGH